jgi:hypothetical protein
LAFVTNIGVTGWRIAQIGALLAFRDRRIILVGLLTFPFWTDVAGGQTMTFVALAGWWAYRGNRFATLAWFGLALLMPRPFVAPLTAWLLWKRPETRVWFVAIFVVHAVLVMGSGLADEWVLRLMASASEIHHPANLAPTALVGMAWMVVGIPMAIWVTYRGRLGLASLLAQPYWFAYYFLMLALDIGRAEIADRTHPVGEAAGSGRVGGRAALSGRLSSPFSDR